MDRFIVPGVGCAILLAIGTAVLFGVFRRFMTADRRSLSRGAIAASLAAICIFLLVYWSAWAGPRNSIAVGSYQAEMMLMRLGQVSGLIEQYAEKNGRYPDTLREASPWVVGEQQLPDIWGNPIQYARINNGRGYRLWSLGRDGKPGGVGLDADFELTGGYKIPITFHQFLFKGEESGGLFATALSAGLCAWLACFLITVPRRQSSVASWPNLLAAATVTVLATLFVVVCLASVYLFVNHH